VGKEIQGEKKAPLTRTILVNRGHGKTRQPNRRIRERRNPLGEGWLVSKERNSTHFRVPGCKRTIGEVAKGHEGCLKKTPDRLK